MERERERERNMERERERGREIWGERERERERVCDVQASSLLHYKAVCNPALTTYLDQNTLVVTLCVCNNVIRCVILIGSRTMRLGQVQHGALCTGL